MSVVISVPSAGLAAALQPLPEEVEVLVWPMDGPAPRPRIDLVVPPYMSLEKALAQLDGVETRLVQSQSIGYEGVADKLPAGTVFANAATVHETSTAELALGLAIAAQRLLPEFVRAQTDRSWAPRRTASLADQRVLLLGYGGVGKAVAARLAPFEVETTVVASRARDEDGVAVHGIDELATLLPTADILLLTLPGGDATRHIIGAAELAALPDGALVVNVGRGSLVDTDALVAEVAAGRLRAALDVVDPEPLSDDHPLWQLDGALLTPHIGGATTAMFPRVAALVRRQALHLLAGEEPENVVLRT